MSNHTGQESGGRERAATGAEGERGRGESADSRLTWANDDVPTRRPRVPREGEYDLSWDGFSGGCKTAEGY